MKLISIYFEKVVGVCEEPPRMYPMNLVELIRALTMLAGREDGLLG